MKIKFLFKIIFTLITLSFLNNCEKFKRFGQEKYFCSPNKLSIQQIDIIKTNSINKAYMVIANKEVQLEINVINKKEVLLTNNSYTIKINKNNNEISISDENKIHFLKCESETFNM